MPSNLDSPPRKRRQPERAIQAQVVKLLRSIGADVWVLGTTRRRGDYHGTMMTPGIPDVFAVLPIRHRDMDRTAFWVEVKAPSGRRSPAQDRFAGLMAMTACAYVCGGLDDVIGYLVDHGYVRTHQLAHYRTEAP